MLTDKQIKKVCCVYGGAHQCRYLSLAHNGCHCLKKNFRLKARIDKEVNKYMAEERKRGGNPWSGYTPIYDGGSCKGFIMLSKKMQGEK